jgi:threonine dehydrogenase-like Zn-dependent dehydrogenase
VGADVAVDPQDGDGVAEAIDAETGGRGAEVLVDATGAGAAVMPEVERALAPGAKVVLLGMQHGPTPISAIAHQLAGAQIHGALGHLRASFEGAIRLHEAGRIDLSAIIGARFGLDDALAAVQRAAARRDAKVIILPTAG